jgi:hypothetical protein
MNDESGFLIALGTLLETVRLVDILELLHS